MVKVPSDSERGNPLPPHRLQFSISSKGSFICITPFDRITHTTDLFYTSRGALAGTRNSSMGPPHGGSIQRPIAPGLTKAVIFLSCIRTPVANREIKERLPTACEQEISSLN